MPRPRRKSRPITIRVPLELMPVLEARAESKDQTIHAYVGDYVTKALKQAVKPGQL